MRPVTVVATPCPALGVFYRLSYWYFKSLKYRCLPLRLSVWTRSKVSTRSYWPYLR